MEGWKEVLADNVISYGNYYGGSNYAVSVNCRDGYKVEDALDEGINVLSSDYKSYGLKYGEPSTVIVTVGSTQARDEFQSRLANIINEVARYRATGFANNEEKLQAELEAKIAELEAKDAEMKQQSDTDTWGIVMVLCVAAALIILLTDK